MHYNVGNTEIGGAFLPRVPIQWCRQQFCSIARFVGRVRFVCGCIFAFVYTECDIHACSEIAEVVDGGLVGSHIAKDYAK